MNHNFNYKDVCSLIYYLGEGTSKDINLFIRADEKEIQNELERLVRKEKLESKIICGEKVYRFVGD